VIEVVLGGPEALFNPSGKLLFDLGAMQPIAVAGGQFWRLFTAMFLHAGLLHVALNAYFFFLFGRMVESVYGKTWMLLIYLVGGVPREASPPTRSDPSRRSRSARRARSPGLRRLHRLQLPAPAQRRDAANLRMALTVIVLNAVIAWPTARSTGARTSAGSSPVRAGHLADSSGPPPARDRAVAGVARSRGRGRARR
jgi:hypothetical protein